jgi:predicted component of type VI protein secretion system
MAPKSERYFLNVKGAMKEMDIAIFKWFLNDPAQVVTIGKSIDCSLQMSWDIKGQVAPVQCEIRMVGDALRLTALEDGVIVGEKALSVGKGIWLYHNTTFQIGDTTFTYIERDL